MCFDVINLENKDKEDDIAHTHVLCIMFQSSNILGSENVKKEQLGVKFTI